MDLVPPTPITSDSLYLDIEKLADIDIYSHSAETIIIRYQIVD